jgi:hypothetical protein
MITLVPNNAVDRTGIIVRAGRDCLAPAGHGERSAPEDRGNKVR